MGRKGIEDSAILREAAHMIAGQGLDGFSLRGLARNLGIQPASLYNHFPSLGALLTRLALDVTQDMNRALYEAIEGRAGDDALRALLLAYREYVHTHPEMYRVVLALPRMDGEEIQSAASSLTGPVYRALEGRKLDPERRIHFQRYLRSLMHGFSTLENRGYMSHLATSSDESYEFIVECVLGQLHALEAMGGERNG